MAKNKAGRWNRVVVGRGMHDDVPRYITCSGTYVLIANGTILYIGESVNIGKRLLAHIECARYTHMWKTKWGYFTEIIVAWKPERKDCDRYRLEAKFIKRIRPAGNKIGGRSWIARIA